jgi:ribonuclease P protein component
VLKKQNRINKEWEYKKLFDKGKFSKSKFFIIRYIPLSKPDSRFGIIVGKKVTPGAVDRNRIKRRVRHIINKNLINIPKSVDMIILPNLQVLDAKFSDIESDFMSVIKKII